MPLNLTNKTAGWLLVVLLVITFSLGALLTITISARNELKENLNEVKKELKDERQESQRQESNFNGCLGALGEINKSIAENALKASQDQQVATDAATSSLGRLPTLIQQDRQLAAKPEAANAWLKDLFK